VHSALPATARSSRRQPKPQAQPVRRASPNAGAMRARRRTSNVSCTPTLTSSQGPHTCGEGCGVAHVVRWIQANTSPRSAGYRTSWFGCTGPLLTQDPSHTPLDQTFVACRERTSGTVVRTKMALDRVPSLEAALDLASTSASTSTMGDFSPVGTPVRPHTRAAMQSLAMQSVRHSTYPSHALVRHERAVPVARRDPTRKSGAASPPPSPPPPTRKRTQRVGGIASHGG